MFKGIKNLYEYIFLLILVVGIIFSLVLDTLLMQIIVIFLFGILAATAQQVKKEEFNFPYILLIIGFVLGYLLAIKSNHRLLIIIFFITGIFAGKFCRKFIAKHIGKWRW
jgi:hypothetical protein